MTFHPFKYKYNAEILEEKEGNLLLRLRLGSTEKLTYFPKALLPEELVNSKSPFVLTIQPKESAEQNEEACLKKLLEELLV